MRSYIYFSLASLICAVQQRSVFVPPLFSFWCRPVHHSLSRSCSFFLCACLSHQGSESYVHFRPRPCFEHLSVGQASHPPTRRTTPLRSLCAVGVVVRGCPPLCRSSRQSELRELGDVRDVGVLGVALVVPIVLRVLV